MTAAVPGTGAAFVPVMDWVARTTGLVPPWPSFAVTSTAIWSPRLPLPGAPRSSVRFVAPAIGVPFRNHWYW